MFALVITWVGLVLGIGLLLMMALGPVIVELDGYLAKRRRARARAEAEAKVAEARSAAVHRPIAA
jgi:hypothetical protein